MLCIFYHNKKRGKNVSQGLANIGALVLWGQGSSFEKIHSIAHAFSECLVCVRPARVLFRGFRD